MATNLIEKVETGGGPFNAKFMVTRHPSIALKRNYVTPMNQLTLLESAEALLLNWREARDGKPLPDSGFIDPLKLRRWIGDISVVHLHEGEKRFFVSLHGANVARHLGPDFHRKYLEDALPEAVQSQNFEAYELSMETNEPTYSVQRRTLTNGLFKSLERLILPCSVNDPAKAERFLVWAAPIETNSTRSSSIYVPFDRDEGGVAAPQEPDASYDLYLLSEGAAVKKHT